jgi:hypothetical protein
MISHGKKYLAVFAFSLIALPVWAAHTDSLSWEPTQAVKIGSTQVMPGQYQLRAEEGQSNLEVVHNGKVIASVPCTWMQLPKKAENSEVQTNNNQVTQVEFDGRSEAIQFNR